MTDVTRSPMCMVNMGDFTIPIGQIGMGKGTKGANENPGGMYHVHWYKYPLISWLNILTTIGCMQGGEYDIGYLSELDPMWMDDNLALFTNPEALLFGNSIAQLACAADAIASEARLPHSMRSFGARVLTARCIPLRGVFIRKAVALIVRYYSLSA